MANVLNTDMSSLNASTCHGVVDLDIELAGEAATAENPKATRIVQFAQMIEYTTPVRRLQFNATAASNAAWMDMVSLVPVLVAGSQLPRAPAIAK
ncbi:hypothetical protein GB928_003305 [Shinella curvata]|uniref:Uncharacterized protein n=1 Tax=Shinella curvata TaxID=1817964 RepID=A0ABT8X9B9_9HYPH|nr:hypothetical protein [Shinella curvata]MCJ8051849.1 hypothetical protein [Shinella curvata]MDO6120203.1 hypothetical protein [Shinella curvata]